LMSFGAIVKEKWWLDCNLFLLYILLRLSLYQPEGGMGVRVVHGDKELNEKLGKKIQVRKVHVLSVDIVTNWT